MLTPKETGGLGEVYVMPIAHAALCEAGFGSSGAPAENAAMALGWKPTAVDTAYSLCDPTHHYLLTIRKAGATVTVWKQDVVLGSYTSTATTYADLLTEALTAYAGAAKGYVSRLVVVESALDFSSFHQASGVVAGLWVPGRLSGLDIHTLLDFANAAALGADASGNGNDWTLAGAVQSLDTPTNNQATLNRAGAYPGAYSDGNATWNGTYSNGGAKTTIGVSSGKWYAEFSKDVDASQIVFGVSKYADRQYYPGYFSDEYGWHSSSLGSFLQTNNTSTVWGTGYTNADRVRIALDMDIGAVWFGKNGTWENGATDAEILAGDTTHAAATWTPDGRTYHIGAGRGGTTCPLHVFFPETSWLHEAPEGFLPLCDMSLPEPAALNVDEHYFGGTFVAPEGGSQTIVVGWDAETSGFGLRLKNISAGEGWHYVSTVTGLGFEVLQGDPGTLFAKSALATPITVNGNTIVLPDDLLMDGRRYVAEVFRIGAESGFNVVAYTGDGIAGRTVSHGLDRAPFFIVSMSNNATTRYKDAYSLGLVNIAGDSYFALFNDNTGAQSNETVWNSTRPDAVNVTLGSNPTINENGSEFALWVWSDSAFYRNIEFWGNGSTDGPFVHLGGRLRGVIASKGAGSSAWAWGNSVVDETNPLTNGGVSPDYSDVFTPATYGAITSMGYKLITSAATYNTNAWAFFGVAVVDQVKYRNAF